MVLVEIVEWTGPEASPTIWTVSSNTVANTARYCSADVSQPGTTYPIPVPDSGYNYSYWKTHFPVFTLESGDSEIRDLKFYGPDSLPADWTGITVWIAISGNNSFFNGLPSSQYDQATGTEGTTGNPFWDTTNGHAYYKGFSPCSGNITTYTSSSPLWLYSGTLISGSGVTDYGWGIVTQAQVSSSATHGTKTAFTGTFVYTVL